MITSNADRLKKALEAAGLAVVGVSVGTEGVAASVKVQPVNLQAAAQATIDAFDWSQAAQTTFENNLEPLLADIKAQADAAIAANDTFLAIATPSNAQNAAQAKALTQQNQRIIKVLVRILSRG